MTDPLRNERARALAAWAAEQEARARQKASWSEAALRDAARWWRVIFGEDTEPEPYMLDRSVAHPGWASVRIRGGELTVEFPLHPDAPRVHQAVVLVQCPTCLALVPAAGGALETLADVGQAIAAGPQPHERGIGGRPGELTRCEGGPPLPEAAAPSAGDLLLTVMEGLVRDVVNDVFGERAL